MDMPKGPFCQSCAMPMEKPEQFGTNADGKPNKDYCTYCYQKGKFTAPNAKMNDMIAKVEEIMKGMNVPAQAIEQTKKFIPTLKRWRA